MKQRWLSLTVCMIAAAFLLRCTQHSPTATLKLSLALPTSKPADPNYRNVPVSASAFHCFAVNVMGPGISEIAPAPNRATTSQIIAGDPCSYPGVVSPLVTPGNPDTTFEVKVPFGTERVVQVLGIISPGGCNLTSLASHFAEVAVSDNTFPGIYEIGRTVTAISGTHTITVANSYSSSTPKEVRCNAPPFDCLDPAYSSAAPFAAGAGTLVNPYRICTVAQFNNVRTYPAGYFRLEDDLNLESAEHTPIGNTTTPFTGQFAGQNHGISNFTIATNNASGIGLFGKVDGEVSDLNVNSVSISVPSSSTVGAVAGINTGVLSNLTVTGGSVLGTNYVGAIVGQNMGTVQVATSNLSVSGIGFVGGFVGENTGNINGCAATGAVTGSGTQIGGFAGATTGGTIAKSFATGSISTSGATNTGGFVGRMAGPSTNIAKCYATGSVTGGLHYSGGFVGDFEDGATIVDSFATGAVSVSGVKVGGFVGLVAFNPMIERSYSNTASITGAGDYSGFCGYSSGGTFVSIYSSALAPTSGSQYDTGTQLTGTQFNAQASFTGWDFVTVWDNSTDTVPPFLR